MTQEQKLPILLQNQNQTDAFQSNKQWHRQNAVGQGKFHTNSGLGKRCLHMDESHCNAGPPNTLHPWMVSKKGKTFSSGRKSRWFALWSSGSLLCPSCFQLSFKVELERLRRTWGMWRDMSRVYFQAQCWQSPCPTFSRMLLMQGRAEECLPLPDRDLFCLAARWTGQVSGNKSNTGKGELRCCSLLMSTDCLNNSIESITWIRTGTDHVIFQHTNPEWGT